MSIVLNIPVSRLEFRKVILSRYLPNILHVYVKRESTLEIKDLIPVMEFVDALGNQLYYNIFEFDKYATTDKDVRMWASDSNGNKHTIADALVIQGLDQKIIADAYLNVNKPARPTGIFHSVEEALVWIESLKNG